MARDGQFFYFLFVMCVFLVLLRPQVPCSFGVSAHFTDAPLTIAAALDYTSGTTANVASTQSLRWAILFDTSHSLLTLDALAQGIRKYVSRTLSPTGQTLFAQEPIMLDSKGNVFTALKAVNGLLSDKSAIPEILFLATTTDVLTAVMDALQQDTAASSILLVSVVSSSTYLCGPAQSLRMVCMAPSDILNVRGVLEMAAVSLRWDSLAMVFSRDGYGRTVEGVVTSQVQGARATPTVLSRVFMNAATSAQEDDALVEALLQYRPKAVACFLREDQMTKLRAAVERSGHDIFLLGSREALNTLSLMGGTDTPDHTSWGALFVPMYTAADKLLSQGYFKAGEIDEYGAFVVSHLWDGMRMVSEAGGTSNMRALRTVRFAGLTGTVAFDTIWYQRVEATFSLITAKFTVSEALATWYLKSYAEEAVITNRDANAIATLIPPSPLRSVVVCLTSPSTCADTELMLSMLLVLLMYNAQTSGNASVTRFLPVALSTGLDDVHGLSTLIPVARTCTALTGPGQASVAVALTPLVSGFKIAQLDYNTADGLFTEEMLTYRYFSRTVPSYSYTYIAYAETCAHFAWERVIILSTADLLGQARSKDMMRAMEQHNIYVEKARLLSDLTSASMINMLNEVYQKDISRILLVLFPLTGARADEFFNLIDTLPFMHNYVFFLSSELCQHGAVYPAQRNKLQSSICILPFVPDDRLTDLNARIDANPALLAQAKDILNSGNFSAQTEKCIITKIKSFAGFAVDAAYLLIEASERVFREWGTFNRTADLRRFLRGTTIDRFTGPFMIDDHGSRNGSEHEINIQVPNAVLTVGRWCVSRRQSFIKVYTSSFLWMTNTTLTPRDTFRDYSFILGMSLTASPGAILLSVLGFVATIGIFFFCYRHYRIQKLIELTLEKGAVPVTEEELRRLRGDGEDF